MYDCKSVNRLRRIGIGRRVPSGRHRRGALIVCVLVLLLIVGLLVSQTVQTLVLVRRGDAMRERLRQARELVELGEIVLRQDPAAEIPSGAVLAALADSTGETSSLTAERGSISFTPVNSSQPNQVEIRITATFPMESSQQFTATKTVIRQESVDVSQP